MRDALNTTLRRLGIISRALLLIALALTGCATGGSTSHNASALHRFSSGADGFDTHSFYLDTGEEVVVFDAQFTPALAEQLLAEIRKTTDSPVTHVVITHPNPDKFNGAPVFRAAGAEVVASAATAKALPAVHAYKKGYFVGVAKMFTEATYPPLAVVDRTFEGALDLELPSGAVVELRELAHSGVSSTQTVAYVPGLDALVVGDLVHHNAHAWLEGGVATGAPAPDLAAWRQALQELLAWKNATVYGGRGEAAPVALAVQAQTAYLDELEQLVRDYLTGLADPMAALSGADAGKHYKTIATQAQAAFPSYGLAYLVEYGVYGLAMSIAASL